MDKQRAEEIIASPSMIQVTFHGMPVYIEAVNEYSANIRPLDGSGPRQLVLLKDLVEH